MPRRRCCVGCGRRSGGTHDSPDRTCRRPGGMRGFPLHPYFPVPRVRRRSCARGTCGFRYLLCRFRGTCGVLRSDFLVLHRCRYCVRRRCRVRAWCGCCGVRRLRCFRAECGPQCRRRSRRCVPRCSRKPRRPLRSVPRARLLLRPSCGADVSRLPERCRAAGGCLPRLRCVAGDCPRLRRSRGRAVPTVQPCRCCGRCRRFAVRGRSLCGIAVCPASPPHDAPAAAARRRRRSVPCRGGSCCGAWPDRNG